MANRCFSAAGGTDKRQRFARGNMEREVIQHLCAVLIGKRNIRKADISLRGREADGIRGVLFGRGIQNLRDAAQTCNAVLILLNKSDEAADRIEKN